MVLFRWGGACGVNLWSLRPSMCTRLLYTILPAPYTTACLFDLLHAWVDDLNGMAEDGIAAP